MRKKRNVGNKKQLKKIILGLVASSVITLNITGSTSLAYDRDKAVEYAKTYWEKYNSEYNNYGNYDCTNFASQILKAGGYKQKKMPKNTISLDDLDSLYKTKTYWCNDIFEIAKENNTVKTGRITTTTWCNVDQLAGSDFYGLQDYMVSKLGKERYVWGISETSINKLAKKAEKGDIIQIAKQNSRFSHTYIVGKVKNGKVYVYSHSGNRDASADDELLTMLEDKVFSNYTLMALIKA